VSVQQAPCTMQAPAQDRNPSWHWQDPPLQAALAPQSALTQQPVAGMQRLPHFLVAPLHVFFFLRFFFASASRAVTPAPRTPSAASQASAPRRVLGAAKARAARSNRSWSTVAFLSRLGSCSKRLPQHGVWQGTRPGPLPTTGLADGHIAALRIAVATDGRAIQGHDAAAVPPRTFAIGLVALAIAAVTAAALLLAILVPAG
jgi:hypothetical protein